MHQERLILDVRKNVSVERVVKHWDRLPREAIESSSLEMCKNQKQMWQSEICLGWVVGFS